MKLDELDGRIGEGWGGVAAKKPPPNWARP